jgi:hypothetical protein
MQTSFCIVTEQGTFWLRKLMQSDTSSWFNMSFVPVNSIYIFVNKFCKGTVYSAFLLTDVELCQVLLHTYNKAYPNFRKN